mgnify:CR=1 FL=1
MICKLRYRIHYQVKLIAAERMPSPVKPFTRGKTNLLPLRNVAAMVVPGTPVMPSSRRKGIVRADAAEHYKQAGFTDKEAEMMIKVLPCTNDLVKKSDLDLHSAKLSAKIDLRSTELSAKLDLRSAELSSKMDLLNVKMEKVLIVVLASGLLLASPEGLAGKLVAALLRT